MAIPGAARDAIGEGATVPTAPAATGPRSLPPVLGRLLRGSSWLALRSPLQAIFAFWSIPLIQGAIGLPLAGAYTWAWSFGFLQFLLEFGMSSSLQRQVSESWTRGDRAGVDRAIACGMTFYAGMALVQAAALLAIAYGVVPTSRYHGDPDACRLIVKLLWLQAATAPCFGLSTVISSVLNAARRYDVLPRLEMAILVARFAILLVGLTAGVDFFLVVAMQTAAQVALSLGPGLWVMVHELGYVPHFRGARREDFAALWHISFYVFLLQLSVVLATSVDTTILAYALAEPGRATTIYNDVSRPFSQIRQTGWTLAYLVMPAVASLAAARDEAGLERIKYDGPRFHVGLLLPVALLAWIYAGPFLDVWVGRDFPDEIPELAYLMRLFLVAVLPLVLSVHVQMAIGMGRVRFVALSALIGSLVNLPISYALTVRLGISGVIWGTVLTTLISNLLAPGVYVFRVLKVRPATFLVRSLGAPLCGAVALVLATWALQEVLSPWPQGSRGLLAALPLLANLAVGCLAYLAGYAAVPSGRGDLLALLGKIRPRRAAA
jgi:O-antigen/teichoic acid export membrane protein